DSNYIFGVAVAPDNRLIASGGNGALVRFLDAATGAPLPTLRPPSGILGIVWSPGGQALITRGQESTIPGWRLDPPATATCMLTFTAHTQQVAALAVSPAGDTLASAGWDGAVKLWALPSGRPLETLSGHTDRVHRVAWSPDGRILASGSYDNTIRLWDVEQ